MARAMVDGGNGASCDICGSIMHQTRVIKVKFFKPDPDRKRFETGMYRVFNRKDLCEKCYKKICNIFVEEDE